MSELNDTQLTYIGKRLDKITGVQKDYPHLPRDFKKIAVFFYDLIINCGHEFTEEELRKAIKSINSPFSEQMINKMGDVVEMMNLLKLGLDEFRKEYGITKKELEENG